MKKRLMLIILVIAVLVVTGCSNSGLNSTNVEKIDSKVDYILFRNKKIYLTESLEDMVLQFKGLGCVFQPRFDSDFEIQIDEINSKNNEFYSLTGDVVSFKVECPYKDSKYPATLTVMFEHTSDDEEKKMYIDRELGYWSIFSLKENVKVSIDGKELLFGEDNDVVVSKLNDAISILGDDYETERFTDDIIYSIGDYEYSFGTSSFDDELNGITVEKE